MLRAAVCRGALGHAAKTRAATSTLSALRVPLAGASSSSAHGSSRSHLLLRAAQSHAFATLPGKDKSKENAAAATPAKTLAELLEENAALRKEVAELQEKVKNKPGKFMAVISQFGIPFVIWWSTLYLGTGVSLYVAFDSGLIAGTDAIKFVMDMGLDRFIDMDRINPTYGNIALAAILNEFLEPLRFPIALATIPTIKRIFSKKKPEGATN